MAERNHDRQCLSRLFTPISRNKKTIIFRQAVNLIDLLYCRTLKKGIALEVI